MTLINKIKENQTLVNGSLFSIFSFINQGLAFLLLIILAKYIMPSEYGKLNLFNTIVQFMGYFIALSTQGYISVSFFQRGKEFFRQDLSSILLICFCCTLLFSLILLISQSFLSKYTELPASYLWFSIIISCFGVIFQLSLDYFRIQERVGIYGLLSITLAILNFALSIYLVINLEFNWEGRIYAQIICSVIFGFIAFGIFYKQKLLTPHITKDGLKKIVLWGMPLIPHLASVWIKQGGDRFIINRYYTLEDVGLFSFALNLTSIIIMVGSAFNAANSVTIFKTLALNISTTDKIQQIDYQARNIIFIYIGATILIVIGAIIGVPLLLPYYKPAIPFFLVLSIQGLGQCIYFLFCNFLFYYHQNNKIMYLTFGTSVLHLLLSLILTRYSLYLTCFVYVIVQFIINIILYIYYRKIIKEKFM